MNTEKIPSRSFLLLAGRTALQFTIQIVLQLFAFSALKFILFKADPEWTHQANGPMLQVSLMFCVAFLMLVVHLLFLLVRAILRWRRNPQAPSSLGWKLKAVLVVFGTLFVCFIVALVLANVLVHRDALPACFKDFGQNVAL